MHPQTTVAFAVRNGRGRYGLEGAELGAVPAPQQAQLLEGDRAACEADTETEGMPLGPAEREGSGASCAMHMIAESASSL